MKHNASMLNPKMSDLTAKIDNRYLLVNVAAQRAREVAQEAEDGEIKLENKPVTVALHEIADGNIEMIPDANHEQKDFIEPVTADFSVDEE